MPKSWKKGLFLGLLALAALGTLYVVFRERLTFVNVDLIASWLKRLGPWAAVIGGGLIILQTFFPVIPFLVIAGANVLVFGLWGGFLVNWISAVTGSILMFFIARTIGREWAERKIKRYPKVQAVNRHIGENSFKAVLILRLFPVIPPAAVNLTAGLASVSCKAFIIATTVGKIPAIFLESIIGHDLLHFHHNKSRFFILLITLIIVIGGGMRILKKKIRLT